MSNKKTVYLALFGVVGMIIFIWGIWLMKGKSGTGNIKASAGVDSFMSGVATSAKLDFSHYVKPSAEELKARLTDIQYDVTQKDGTEKPFDNAYNENHRVGIYVDIVSGEPLFSSADKYESGTGWPSFVKPIDSRYIVEKVDTELFPPRTEVRSRYGDSHLGHVFSDGPADRGGMRYCMNSAALRFVSAEEMEQEGYGDLLPLVSPQ